MDACFMQPHSQRRRRVPQGPDRQRPPAIPRRAASGEGGGGLLIGGVRKLLLLSYKLLPLASFIICEAGKPAILVQSWDMQASGPRQSLSSPGTCRNRGPGCRASGLMVGAKGAGAIEPMSSPRSTLALTLTAVTRGASAPPPKPSLFQTTWEKGTSLASMTQN